VHLPREEGYRHKHPIKNGPALAGYGAITMKNALAATMSSLPEVMRRSLTWDRGKELSAHAQFKIETGIPVFFADPHSPWQRGTNESTNGLLRQYFPKGTDLSRWSAEDLAAVAATLNSRPRKTSDGRRQPKPSTSNYCPCTKPVLLRRSIEPGQFRSHAYVRELRSAQLRGSMGRVGACLLTTPRWSRFFSLLQKNVLDRRRWQTRDELRLAIVVWIEQTYHRRRRQDGLGRLTRAQGSCARSSRPPSLRA